MKYLSVCSGIEAATAAWEPLGWEPLAFSEIEPFPSAVLAHHWPHVPNLGDFTTIQRDDIDQPDLLIGGTPCQAFSVAGLRQSLEDDRGNLTLEFVRLADRLDDGRLIVVWENVPGVLSTPDNAFGCFLGALVGCDTALVPTGNRWTDAGVVLGPTRMAAWRVLDAQYFGVAQRRRRVFVVASAREGFDPAAVLLERDGVCRDTAPRREPREGAAGGSGFGVAGSGGGGLAKPLGAHPSQRNDLDNDTYVVTDEVAHTLTQRYDSSEDGTGRGTPLVLASGHSHAEIGYDVCTTTTARQHKDPPIVMAPAFSKRPGQQIATRDDGVSFALTGGAPPSVLGGGFEPMAVRTAQTNANGHGIAEGVAHTLDGANGQAIAFAQNQLGEVRTGEVSGTLNTNGNATGRNAPLVQAQMAVRRLTPRECERLQGFPDDHTRIPYRGKPAEACPDGPRYKACGNSMAVPVIRWIGRRIEAVSTMKGEDTCEASSSD